MSKIQAILVEDEARGMEKLSIMLADYCPTIEVVEKCYDGKSGIQAIEKHRPQLVFLDLDLGSINGFDVLSGVSHITFETVIITGDDSKGIQAVKVGAIDYLVKPFSLGDLQNAIAKVTQKRSASTTSPKEISKIALPDTFGINLVPVDEILFCEADNNSTKVHFLKDRKSLFVTKTLGKIMEKLPTNKFCRISRSHTIHLDYVSSYSRLDGGSITLTNGKILLLKPGKFKDQFLERLKEL